MDEVSESLRALLDSARSTRDLSRSSDDFDDDEEDIQLEDEQAMLCTNVVNSLEKLSNTNLEAQTTVEDPKQGSVQNEANSFIRSSFPYKNGRNQSAEARTTHAPFSATNVREVFSDYNASLSQLPMLLSSLMMTRVDTEKLMPATQDAEANEAAMKSSSAMMLTRPALASARLYATLLAIPGALGSGLIEMETVSSLAALFRRWRVEACTAMDQLLSQKSYQKSQGGNKKMVSGKRKSTKSTTTNPIKRGKKGKRVQIVEGNVSSDDDSFDGRDDQDQMNAPSNFELEDHDDIISADDLLILGMQAGLALSQVLWQKEFLSWSSEAREAVIDAVTSLHGTVAALVTPSVQSKLSDDIVELQQKVVHSTSLCIQHCILAASQSSTDIDDDQENYEIESPSEKRHETSVFILRGLYPVMVMREHLPNGGSGKQIACEIATETLQGFITNVATDIMTKSSSWATPNDDTASNRGAESVARRSSNRGVSGTPVTSKKGRKKRVSFGALDNSRRTPVLKSGKKNRPTSGTTPGKSPNGSTAKPRPVLSAVLGLMQKLATTKGLDRANFRRSIAKSLQVCLIRLPTLERAYFLRFMNSLCSSKLAIHRLLVSELLGVILAEPWLWEEHKNHLMLAPESQAVDENDPNTPPGSPAPASLPDSPSSLSTKSKDTIMNKDCAIPLALLEALTRRLSDRAPAVRTCAAGSFANLFHQVAHATQKDESNEEAQSSMIEVSNALALKRHGIAFCLRQRALEDDKAFVRKAAINALAEVTFLGSVGDAFPVDVGEEEVAAFGKLCSDSSMATRKVAAQALTSLLERCTAAGDQGREGTLEMVARAWTASVLPMTLDPDSSCAAKAVDLVNETIFQPIILDTFSTRPPDSIEWKILSFVCESSSTGSACTSTNALKAALGKLSAAEGQKGVSKALLQRICELAANTIDGSLEDTLSPEVESQRAGVWCLLDTIVDQTENLSSIYQILTKLRIDLNFLGSAWQRMLQLLEVEDLSKTSEELLQVCVKSCLRVLSKLSTCVTDEVAQHSATKLRALVQNFSFPPDLIGEAVGALAATSVSSSGEQLDVEQVRSLCREMVSDLNAICEDSISAYAKNLTGHSEEEAVEELCVRAIFTVGQLATIGFCPDEDDSGKSKDDPLRGFSVPPSRTLVELLLAFLPKEFMAGKTPETVRAHSFIALGKLCLRDEQLAKRCVTIFARELARGRDENDANGWCFSAKSNALLVLGDLCIRYTSLVDKYLPVMAGCLQTGVDSSNLMNLNDNDNSAIVRKNAVILLSSLLLQDYLKWRGLLFHRFLVATVDNDDSVAELSEGMLVGPLLGKSPKLFFNNFVESMFVFNRCEHPIYAAAKAVSSNGSGVDFDGIHLNGPAGREKRFRMYELSLSTMSDEEKIGITARIARDVLGNALSDTGVLHSVCVNPSSTPDADPNYESAFNVLKDAFAILSSKSLRVGKGSGATDDDEQDDIGDPNVPNPARRVIAARGKLLSKISLKHLVEIVFPILRNLKVVLQKSCSPLLKDLMQYMLQCFRAYKNEVKDFLSDDPTLLQEIEYDARRQRQSKSTGGAAKP